MLVEVNLLPEKQKRDITYMIIVLIVLLLMAIGTTVLFLYEASVNKELDTVNSELYEVQIEAAQLQQQINVMDGESDYERLEQAVDQIGSQIVPTSLLLDQLVNLLPERGYYLTFDYENLGTVNFEASFDRIEEVAAYHQALEQSDFVSSISLSVVDTYMLEEEEEENDLNVYTDVIPRYTASFMLNLNTDNVRKLGDPS